MRTVGLIGYGEVGRILAEDLRARGVDVVAYDLKLDDDRRPPLAQHAAEHGTRLAPDHAAVAREVDLVISAVTASQTVQVAQALARGLEDGTFVVDMNSASPGAKQEAFAIVDEADGRYVEGAVMTSVPPHRLAVPLLLGGPHAADVAPLLTDLGFSGATVHDERLGIASATKLSRSVVIKGMEALFVESLTSARHFGVEDAVIASFTETFPGIDWEAQATWFFRRAIQHGLRRSEEMQEAARTVAEAGLPPLGATAAAERQRWLGEQHAAGTLSPTTNWRESADAILEKIKED